MCPTYEAISGGVQSRERLEIRQKITDDFTNRLVAESELSGVTWSLRRDDMKAVMRQMTKLPKGGEGSCRFDNLEREFHASKQQT